MTAHILLLGRNGQVGWELEGVLQDLGEVEALGKEQLDLSHLDEVRERVRASAPDLIVNAAAYTAVDRAEVEPHLAEVVNAGAPGVLAEECVRLGAGLIQYSTDYVFDGEKGSAYTELDGPNPINIYGATKLAGERAILDSGANALILRTSWVYSLRRECFVTRVIGWALEKTELRIVDDQVSTPTWCRTVAEATAAVLRIGQNDLRGFLQDHRGVLHLADSGQASRFEWAGAILAQHPQPDLLMVKQLVPVPSEEFLSLACRPACSALDCRRLGDQFGLHMPAWDEDLANAFVSQRELIGQQVAY